MKKPNATTVAKINNIDIVVIENGEKRIAIKPICEALGIDPDSQRKKIQSDEILCSVTVLSAATGKDGKEYEMATIPYMFVFGWLFSINPKNVAPAARESVVKYKLECYQALWNHFSSYADFVEAKTRMIDEKLTLADAVRLEFNQAKDKLKEVKEELDKARKMSFEEYQDEIKQMKIPFDDNSPNPEA